MEKSKQTVNVIGGIGDMWGGQYRQQFRVIEKKQVSYAINASGIPILVVKKWKNELKR